MRRLEEFDGHLMDLKGVYRVKYNRLLYYLLYHGGKEFERRDSVMCV